MVMEAEIVSVAGERRIRHGSKIHNEAADGPGSYVLTDTRAFSCIMFHA
jgi:hypothetical protein